MGDIGRRKEECGARVGERCQLFAHMFMSSISEKGVSDVKAAACDKLLAVRVDARVSTKKGMDSVRDIG